MRHKNDLFPPHTHTLYMGEPRNFFSEKVIVMNKLFLIVPLGCFVLGIASTWVFLMTYDNKLFQVFGHAYSVGKADGYQLGFADKKLSDFSFSQSEAHCMFLYADKGKLFGTQRKK